MKTGYIKLPLKAEKKFEAMLMREKKNARQIVANEQYFKPEDRRLIDLA